MLLNVLFSYCPQSTININGSIIKSSNSQKLLGVTTDSNFTFQEQINSLCQKSSQKLYAFVQNITVSITK